MKLLKLSAAAWIVYVAVYVAQVGYEHRYIWKGESTSGSMGTVVLGGGNLISTAPAFVTAASLKPISKKLDDNDAPRVPAPADHPPLTFVAGANTWHVRYTTHEYLHAAGFEAWTDSETHEVWLSVSDGEARETMTHELLHVARTVAREMEPWSGMEFDSVDENYFVQPSAPYLQHILRDNKQLAEWIRQ